MKIAEYINPNFYHIIYNLYLEKKEKQEEIRKDVVKIKENQDEKTDTIKTLITLLEKKENPEEKISENKQIEIYHHKEIKLACRNTTLVPLSCGFTFHVHNGKKYVKVFVSEEIIGHKLGEFSKTRARYVWTKPKKKGKKK
jgi:small subunit ribosomal protein S19